MRASGLGALGLGLTMLIVAIAPMGATAAPTRVLVFSRTTGFRHASIEDAHAAIERLGARHGFEVEGSEDPAVFEPAQLRRYDAVVFVSTTGNPITDTAQQAALRHYVEQGGGFVGVHAATDQDEVSQATWPWFEVLLGAYFEGHPLYRTRPSGDESCAVGGVVSCHTGTVRIEDRRHPATRQIVKSLAPNRARVWDVYDEFYGFSMNPRDRVHVLATLDEGSYLDDPNRLEFGPGAMGEDHPIAWCQRVGRGRSFYTGLGHDPELFSDRRYLSHLLGGIQWAAGRGVRQVRGLSWSMTTLGPRLVVAGTHSGVGKTTVATGVMAALRGRGVGVASAKVGPDFIDPGYHALATGRAGTTLDPWMCGDAVIAPLAAHGARDGRVLIVEGVMGLFDGASDDGATASTAHVAQLLDAPVLLVVDAAGMSGSVAALVHGFATFDPATRIAGVILNRVRGDRHELLLREALDRIGIPVVGALPRRDDLAWRDRHLGLVPVVEHVDAARRSVEHLGEVVAGTCDLEALRRIAESAPRRAVGQAPSAQRVADARIGVASGPAFDFVYPENLELLEEAGADLAAFDPLIDHALPEGVDALYAGGGFPEVFAAALGDNRPLLDEVRARVGAGLVTWAECGGYLWLCASLDGVPMAGALPAAAKMTDRLTLGYRTATPTIDTPVALAGSELRGHEFHYSTVDPPGDALEMDARFERGRGGFGSQTLLASYLHLHLAGAPEVAERFVRCAASTRTAGRGQ